MQKLTANLEVNMRETNNMVSAKPISQKVDFYKAFWMLFIGSVVGFGLETIWCLIKHGRLECRSSLLFVPFTVVYGVGALLLYAGLRNIGKNNILHIFTFGAVAGSAVEYLFSFLQEKFFGTVSWDYSASFLSIGGRICLWSALTWGLLAVLWIQLLQPFFVKMITRIPQRAYKVITWGLVIFIVISAIISIAAVVRWNMRLDGIPAMNSISMTLDKWFPNEIMYRVYPNMIFGG